MCTHVGQVVTWIESRGIRSTACSDYAILDKTNIDAIKTTFENVKVYLENLLMVKPADHPYQIENWSDWTSFQPKTVSDVELSPSNVSTP